MEEAKTIEIECIELQSHLSFSNMSTLLVANEHPILYCCLVSVYLVGSCL